MFGGFHDKFMVAGDVAFSGVPFFGKYDIMGLRECTLNYGYTF